ncbi:formate/nitrite transporter family protein [Brachybacterium muris]|uniref:Formate transporter n=1 Tax=Brachybacterium muris UCD-AY4 TaxID=1249481 RepID=A0A022KU80_9MICO|nr:formate/nitrite transporter family protein [Brachybacterium muris]EYT49633.1 formate transporter [Brachybacterium muris UCD-AY4]
MTSPSSGPGSSGTPAPAAAPAPSTQIPAPKALAKALEDGMYAKATTPYGRMFLLSLTGGAFIAWGFIYMVTSQQGMAEWPTGIAKVLGGVVFSVGLGLVVISGSDLFTGTTMTVMPWLSKRITAGRMLAHWGISITGNFIGSALMALLILLAGVHASNGGAWGLITLNTSLAKVSYDWPRAFFLGLLANFAVCLAVWIATAGKTVTDKILAVIGPISLFVATGLEHSVANMFMLPMGLMVKYGAGDEFWNGAAVQKAGVTVDDFAALTPLSAVWDNLIPVILGNIVGGAVFVGVYFWLAYNKPETSAAKEEARKDS